MNEHRTCLRPAGGIVQMFVDGLYEYLNKYKKTIEY
jgi:hypothetical protein